MQWPSSLALPKAKNTQCSTTTFQVYVQELLTLSIERLMKLLEQVQSTLTWKEVNSKEQQPTAEKLKKELLENIEEQLVHS
jgi:hypothetical protein